MPQAPSSGGGRLLITAAVAESHRANPVEDSTPTPPGTGTTSSSSTKTYTIFALVALVTAIFGLVTLLKPGDTQKPGSDPGPDEMWTDQFDRLQLPDSPATGRLNGWKFVPTQTVWKGTRLTLRQDGGKPEALELNITFPLKGGELVAGKSYQLHLDEPPFSSPIQIAWQDDEGAGQSRAFPSGYLLNIRFDAVSKENVSGRMHLCLPDPTHSWVAGSFWANVETNIK